MSGTTTTKKLTRLGGFFVALALLLAAPLAQAQTAALRLTDQVINSSGRPIVNGYIYIGAYQQDPVANPLALYSDPELTTPIANPQRTDSFGRPVNDIYVAETRYSYQLKDVTLTSIEGPKNRIAPATVAGTIRQVATIAALKAITGMIDGQLAEVSCYYTCTTPDGGGGLFRYDSSAATSDNGGTVIDPTAIGNGRWERVYDGDINVVWFGAKRDGTTDDSTAFNNALALSKDTFAPDGTYALATPVKIQIDGQRLYGNGYHTTKLRWTGTDNTKNMIELLSGRRDTGNASASKTGLSFGGFKLESASGSALSSGIWVEAGVFHSVIENLYMRDFTGRPVTAFIKYDAGTTQSYSVGVNMRDVVMYGGLNDSLTSIPIGIWLEAAIEASFHNVKVFNMEDCLRLGTSDLTRVSNIANVDFIKSQFETGDRGYVTAAGAAVRIYQAKNVNFIGSKLVAGADFAATTNQAVVRFSSTTGFRSRNINFIGSALWGMEKVDKGFIFDSTADYGEVNFTGNEVYGFVTDIISIDSGVDPMITYGRDNTHVNITPKPAKFNVYAETYDPASLNDGDGENRNTGEAIGFDKTEPVLLSLGVDLQGMLLTAYGHSSAGLWRSRLQNETGGVLDLVSSRFRIRRMYPEEVDRMAWTRQDPASMIDGSGQTLTMSVPGMVMGDIIIGQFMGPDATNLNGVILNANMQSNGTAAIRLQNETAGSRNPSMGDLRIFKLQNWDRYGSASYDPPNLVDGDGVTTTVTVTGTAVGDFSACSFGVDMQGIILQSWSSAADTVSVRYQNETGGAIDLASSTIRCGVFKRYSAL